MMVHTTTNPHSIIDTTADIHADSPDLDHTEAKELSRDWLPESDHCEASPVPGTSRVPTHSYTSAGSPPPGATTSSGPGNHLSRFFLSLKARNVPQAICNDIVAEFKTFASNIVSECCEKIQEACPEQHPSIDLESLPTVARLHRIDQKGKLEKYASSELLMVKPTTIMLVNITDDGKVRSCQFVSVRRQLEVLMANPKFRESIQLSFCATSGLDEAVYADIADGTAHNKDTDNVLRLVLYFDEFQVSCVVGNKTKKYSIGAVYFAIANLPQRSRLDEIHLALLFHKNHIEMCSWDQLLRPLVDDLKGLESDGFSVMWEGKPRCIKAHVELLVGDNLGIHSIVGLFSSFRNTNRLCRMCHATAEEMQVNFKESDFKMRSKTEYENELKILEQEQYNHEIQKIFGIKHACVLNELQSFHTSSQTPFDCSHDIFEGVIIYALNTIFTSLVSLRVIDKTLITKMIHKFPYHRVDTNRPQPPTCSGDVKFKETCSEAWTLLRLVPLMLKHVAEDEVIKKCKLHLVADLIEIVQRVMAHSFTDADIEALAKAIEKWMRSFKSEFPEFRFKPKFHYLLHYASQIKAHGPPRKYMTIRFEAKHQAMKSFLSTSKNRKNVCLTMAKKHQIMMCDAQSKPSYLMEGMDRRALQPLPTLPRNIGDMWDCPVDDLLASKSVTYSGTKYVIGDVLVVKLCDEFCSLKVLKHIVVHSDSNDCRLICSALEGVTYCSELQAFRVIPSNSMDCVTFDVLAEPHPLGIYHIRGNDYVVTKTQLSRKLR